MSARKQKWEGITGGGRFGQRFLFWILSLIKVNVLYPILFIVIPFYILFGRKGYLAIYRYFRIQHRQTKWKSFCATFRNYLTFGEVVPDKFALLAGNTQQFDIRMKGLSYFNELLNQEKGFIIASAHIGNFELVGHAFKQNAKKINGIVFGGEAREFQKQRIKSLHKSNVELIPVSDDMSHIFTIKTSIDNGNIITLPCDRMFGSQKKYTTTFLGTETSFPIGTFRLAGQLEVPVLAMFIMKEKGLHYQGYIFPLQALTNEKSSVKKAEFLAQQYVQFLENMVKKYPEQWFNFFNFFEN